MRRLRTVALVLALVAAACGGGDDDASSNDDGNIGGATGGGDDPGLMSTDFDLSNLPDDFPGNLVPPSWTAGQVSDLLGPIVVNFESDMGFDDAVAYYNGILGESNQIVGDPGEQLAQWTKDPVWLLSIFDGDPMIIGFTDLRE